MKLLVRPKPRSDESFMGYILRLTERNGYLTPSWILEASGLQHKQLHKSSFLIHGKRESLTPLARLLGVDIDDLTQITYKSVRGAEHSDLYDFFGQPVRQYLIRPARPKICPGCLSGSQHCRRVWEFTAVTTCPKHKRQLIGECPRCNKRLSWTRKSVALCSCEFDLHESPAARASERELKLSSHIYRLCGLPASGSNQNKLSGPASKLSLNDFLTALFFVAGQSKGISAATSKNLAVKGTDRDLHDRLTEAFSVFEEWPNNYFRFLEGRADQEKNIARPYQRMKSEFYSTFGSFYSGLCGVLAASQFDFMRDAFIGYSARSGVAGSPQSDGSREGVMNHSGRGYMLKSDLRRLLGVDYTWIGQHIRAGNLRTEVHSKGKKRLIFVALEDATKLREKGSY
jgi:hypothetical protein